MLLGGDRTFVLPGYRISREMLSYFLLLAQKKVSKEKGTRGKPSAPHLRE